MSKPRLMITGAAGFLGTAFWRQFQDKYDLFGIDKYGYASHKDERKGTSIRVGNCANFGEISDALDDAGAIYSGYPATYPTVDKLLILHSETHNDNSFGNPLEFYKSNVMGFVEALEAARRHKIPKVYAVITDEVILHHSPVSSAEASMYERPRGFEEVRRGGLTFYRAYEVDAPYNTQYNPTSPYSSSKACQEMIINAYKHSYNMDIVTIRPTNIYGPLQHPEKLISKAITNLLAGKKVPIYGEGAQYRDYTFVEDTCRALDLIMSAEEPHHTYHIAANDERQNIETVREILHQLNLGEDMIDFIPDPRPIHDYAYSLDCYRLRKLGWRPEVDFSTGIAKTIDYYKNLI